MTTERASLLIVDDDRAIRMLLLAHLGSSYSCSAAASADEATRLLEEQFYHLVLTDITMPGASGLDLCHVVRRTCPDTVVVMISALADIDHAAGAMRRGAFDYIAKPFQLDRVSEAVERALGYQALLAAKNHHEQLLEEKVLARTTELTTANHKLNIMVDTLSNTYRATLRSLARILEARDLETRGHSDRVVAYSLRLAKEIGVDPKDLLGLEQGALLHDIGKIGVRDSVLLKQGALTEPEQALMRQHVAHGLRIIEGIDFLSGAEFVIGQHHEKYNGSGYPAKLHQEEIHVNARIFAVADAYDAITSDRPYRAASPYLTACNEIVTNAGTHFDPLVVEAFLGVPQAELKAIRETIEGQGETDLGITKDELHSFILSLHCPVDLTGKLTELCG